MASDSNGGDVPSTPSVPFDLAAARKVAQTTGWPRGKGHRLWLWEACAEIERLREALGYYAANAQYHDAFDGEIVDDTLIARSVLGEKP